MQLIEKAYYLGARWAHEKNSPPLRHASTAPNDPEPTTQPTECYSNAPHKRERDALLNTQRYSTPPRLLYTPWFSRHRFRCNTEVA